MELNIFGNPLISCCNNPLTGYLGDEIYDLMSHVWGDEGNESLMNHFSEEVTNKILQDSGKYLDTKN